MSYMSSAAYTELVAIIETYAQMLPVHTFPYVMLSIAAVFQVLAWFGGTLLPNMRLAPRVFALWLLALIEYCFMSPTMSASVELLQYEESYLVILNHVLGFVVFIAMNALIFKSTMTWRHIFAMCLVLAGLYIVAYDDHRFRKSPVM